MSRNYLKFAFLIFLLVAACLASIFLGGASIGFGDILRALFNSSTGAASMIIWKIRVPRFFLAAFVGLGLSVSGSVFQGMLKNPLADPYTLGISGGAALGATLGITSGLASLNIFLLPVFAFLGALLSFWLVFLVASKKNFSTHTLILTGIILGFIFSSLVLLILTLSSPDKMQSSMLWLMGDLSFIAPSLIKVVCALITAGALVLMFYSNELNILTMGEEKASHLGVETEKLKKILFLSASLVTGACVCVCGVIGFVGLIIPHVMRKFFGPDYSILIPACALGGALFLPVCDIVARSVIAPLELPVGIITGLAGGVFFLTLLFKAS